MRCLPYQNSSYKNPVDGHIEGAPDPGSIFNPQKPKGDDVIPVEQEPQGSISKNRISFLIAMIFPTKQTNLHSI